MVEDASDVLWAIEVDGVELTRVKPGESVVVGRKPIRPMVEADADRRVDVADSEKSMSKRHAKLTVDAYGRAMLEDLGSTNGTFVVRDDGGLMRVPLGTQITFQRSPMHLQFGDKAVDFREVSSDDTGEHPVQSLFENLTPDQIANAANGAMSVDQILDVRAGEPTTAFDANAVRGRVHELNTAHLVQSYVTTSPAPEEWDDTHGPTNGAEGGAQGGAQGSVLVHNGAYSHADGIVTESVVAENVVAQAAAHDDSDEANAGIRGADSPSAAQSASAVQSASVAKDASAVGGALAQDTPAGAMTPVVAEATTVAAAESVTDTASVESASQPFENETEVPASEVPDAADAVMTPGNTVERATQSQQSEDVVAAAEAVDTAESVGAAESRDVADSPVTDASVGTVESTGTVASTNVSESEDSQTAGNAPTTEEETQSQSDSQSPEASSCQSQAQARYQAQNETPDHEASYPVTASFPIRRTYTQATNYSGDYQTTDSSTWPATGQHHGFDSEAANLSAASAAAQTYPATDQGMSAVASDARFRPQQEEDERFAVHQQSQQEMHESRGGSDNTSAFAQASFSTPVTNPRYDAGSVLDRLSNGQFPAQQADSEDDRLIDGFSIRQARTTADYQQQFRMAQHPQLLPFLAMNPSLYGDLYAWLAAQGNADVESALNGNAGYLAWKQGK
ncbi:variant leucine-rich repeat-containing protein [Pseudoscardovia suis]